MDTLIIIALDPGAALPAAKPKVAQGYREGLAQSALLFSLVLALLFLLRRRRRQTLVGLISSRRILALNFPRPVGKSLAGSFKGGHMRDRRCWRGCGCWGRANPLPRDAVSPCRRCSYHLGHTIHKNYRKDAAAGEWGSQGAFLGAFTHDALKYSVRLAYFYGVPVTRQSYWTCGST